MCAQKLKKTAPPAYHYSDSRANLSEVEKGLMMVVKTGQTISELMGQFYTDHDLKYSPPRSNDKVLISVQHHLLLDTVRLNMVDQEKELRERMRVIENPTYAPAAYYGEEINYSHTLFPISFLPEIKFRYTVFPISFLPENNGTISTCRH